MNHILVILILLLVLFSHPCHTFSTTYQISRRTSLRKTPIGAISNTGKRLLDTINHDISMALSSGRDDMSSTLQVSKSKSDVKSDVISVSTARAILLLVSAFYGTNFACVKILGEAMDPSFAAFLRFTVASLVFSPNLLKIINSNRQLFIGGLEVGLYSALGYWGQSQALLTSQASAAAFICSLAVIVVPILDLIFKKGTSNKPWYESILPAGLAVIGVGCLELGGSTLPNIGDLWAFIQPLMFGLGFWRIEHHMKSMKGIEGEAQGFTGAMMLTVALCSLAWTVQTYTSTYAGDFHTTALSIYEQLSTLKDWHVLAAIGWTGIFTTAITSYGENVAMTRLSAAESTVIYSTEPLWGTAFAAFALHESIGWNTVVGAILVCSACLWSALGPTLSMAGVYSSMKGSLGPGVEEIIENFMENMSELSTRLGSITNDIPTN